MLSKDLSPTNAPSSSISITTKASPIIKTSTQSNPGLSFFCQPIVSLSKPAKPAAQPMVVSRINLPISRPKEEEEEEEEEGEYKKPHFNPVPNKMGIGIGTFMLRGILSQQKALDEARVHRRIEDLEIEKKSLLNLNKTLESVVKEQTNTIIDLRKRLAAVEKPLVPDLDTAPSKSGIMSSHEEEEDAAFEKIRTMLIQLIQQAQSAVSITASDDDSGHKKVIKPKKPLTPPTSPTPNNNLHRTTSKTSIHSQPSHRTTSRPSNSPTLHRTTSRSSINSQSSTLSKRSSKFNINKSSKTPQVKKWQN
ncbi:hypothetical protein G6F70_003057 [Rhizopus microsporus]|nr:hypothetical protein G6F70_003057 [Rhizopus microsporus]KAG1213574.1 hypothetical protein G6F69_002674 [Rhizopus microsporus]KAG1238047.1 hypothetical protein G6F67_000701 [Rhizopus microsporus]KAG1269338.1 hypothetical protein G6F68_000331 [Rhizopus microsporus]